jgi:hypothetical protein
MAADGPERAIDYLRRIGCYRLSGYWFALRKRSDPLVLLDENGKKPKSVRVETFAIDEVKEGTRFQDAVDLYAFDKQLRMPALDALERIEVAIRVEISHTLCLPQARTAVRGFCSQLEFGYMPHAAAPVVWQASAVGRARARNSSNTTRLSTGCRWRCGLLAKLGTWYVVHALQRHARAGAGQDRRPLWPERRACFCHLVTQPELFAQRLRTPPPPLQSKCRRSAQAATDEPCAPRHRKTSGLGNL